MNRSHLLLGAALVTALLIVVLWARKDEPVTATESVEESGAGQGLLSLFRKRERVSGSAHATAGTTGDERIARGTLVDAVTKAPLAGFVRVTRDDRVIAETPAEADGRFEVPCADGAALEAIARGFLRRKSPFRCADDLVLALARGVEVRGSVRAPAGEPASGATVSCIEGIQMRSNAETAADEAGAFEIVCAGGTVHLGATHASGSPVRKTLGAKAAGEAVEGVVLTLGAGRRLLGSVIYADGTPSSAKLVIVEDGRAREPSLVTTVEPPGTFATTISHAAHRVIATSPEGRVAVAQVPAGAEDIAGVEIRLPAWNTVRGRVIGPMEPPLRLMAIRDRKDVDSSGDDAVRARESYSSLLTGGTYHRRLEVPDREFELAGFEPGKYSLRATSALSSGEVEVTVPAEGEVVIEMLATATLEVQVEKPDGKPSEGGTLIVEIADSQRHMGYQRDGATARGLELGEAKLTLVPRDAAMPEPRTVTLRAGTNAITWKLSGDVVSAAGKVVDASTNLPIAGATVSPTLREWYGWRSIGAGTTTGDDGTFAIDVRSLDALLFIYHPGHESRVVPASEAGLILLQPGEAEDQVRLPKEEFDRVVKELRESGKLYEPGKSRK